MASFIAKQLVGKQLDAVKGAVGGGDDKKDEDDSKKDENGEDLELVEQRREEEERRREKHRAAEAEREEMRAVIRKKYNIKKREDFPMEDTSGQIGRKRKTPEELAAEARGESTEEGGEQGGFLPANISDMQAKLTEGPGQLLSSAQEKCSLM